MKIIFFGSDDFATVNLEGLINSSHDVIACVAPPDRAKGRGLKIVDSPVKSIAQENNIPVLQPMNPNDSSFVSILKEYNSDIFVVVAYGKILSLNVLTVPKYFAINIHGSLLPKYRGAAPINWAIINGEKETGISIIRMNEKMDAGNILMQSNIIIDIEDTSVTLRAKMAKLGSDCLIEVVDSLEREPCKEIIQNERDVSFAPKLNKDLGKIDWNKSAIEIHNLVRGLLPWPSAYTFFQSKCLKILETEVYSCYKDISNDDLNAGSVIGIEKDGFVVSTGKEFLLIKKVHLESSKSMGANSFALGRKVDIGYEFK